MEKSTAADAVEIPVRLRELLLKEPTNIYELEAKKSYERVLKRRLNRHNPIFPSPLAVGAEHKRLPTSRLQAEAEPPSPDAATQPEDLGEPTAAGAATAPVKFQKELLFQQPTSFFELEVKRSYQRVLKWSVKRRISELDDEEETLRYVQLRQTYKIIRDYKVSQMS